MCTQGHHAAAHLPDMGDPDDLDEEMPDASFEMDPEISERIQQVIPSANVLRQIQIVLTACSCARAKAFPERADALIWQGELQYGTTALVSQIPLRCCCSSFYF